MLRCRTRAFIASLCACSSSSSRVLRAITTTTGSSNDKAALRDADGDAVSSSSSSRHRQEGYGPFSVTVRPRRSSSSTDDGVVNHMGLASNANLRHSLGGLSHPTQQRALVFRSPAWRLSMVRLYRTILRLHNKTVTVSLQTSVRSGAAHAVSAVTGVTPQPDVAHADDDEGGRAASAEDSLQRFLLSEEQRLFGNRFVANEFANHRDADERAATTFYAGWYDYVLQLASGVTARDMRASEVRLLTEEQQERLRQLRQSFRTLHEQASTTSPYNAPPI